MSILVGVSPSRSVPCQYNFSVILLLHRNRSAGDLILACKRLYPSPHLVILRLEDPFVWCSKGPHENQLLVFKETRPSPKLLGSFSQVLPRATNLGVDPQETGKSSRSRGDVSLSKKGRQLPNVQNSCVSFRKLPCKTAGFHERTMDEWASPPRGNKLRFLARFNRCAHDQNNLAGIRKVGVVYPGGMNLRIQTDVP